jgi:hypothetical protein
VIALKLLCFGARSSEAEERERERERERESKYHADILKPAKKQPETVKTSGHLLKP